MANTRLLVTGGAGFIGCNTVEAIVREGGFEFAILDDLSSGKREQVHPAARFYHADLRNRELVKQVMERERPELVLHLAAQMDVRRSVAEPAFDADVNLVGLLNLMEAGRANGLRRVVFASSGGAIYGEQEVFPCDEDHPCRPVSPYGVAKLASERYLFFYQVQYGISSLALRYANVYGPRQDPHGEAGVVAIFCGRILEGRTATIFGAGDQTRDYVFVEDIVRANLAGLKSRICGAFNIGTGIETSVNELFQELAGVSGSSIAPVHGPARPGEQQRSVIAPGRAAGALGWRPEVTLREGLARTFGFFKEHAQT